MSKSKKRKVKSRVTEESSPLRNPLPVPKRLEGVAHKLYSKQPLDRPLRTKKGRRRGHPADLTSEDKRRAWFVPQDKREVEIREINRLQREAIRSSPEEAGTLRGPMDVLCMLAAQSHAAQLGITDLSQQKAIAVFLANKVYDAIATFSVSEYDEWREACRQEMSA